MAEFGEKWRILRSLLTISWSFLLAIVFVSAERSLKYAQPMIGNSEQTHESNPFVQLLNFLWQSNESGYQHVWPEMKFGWKIFTGTVVGFCGAAFGSVGGVGGGGIFVPMLTLIIGFDAKSATALSKCKILAYYFWSFIHGKAKALLLFAFQSV
ncbi:hypothetical protein Ancab_002170 [Ancistrocladus abbreviatus]